MTVCIIIIIKGYDDVVKYVPSWTSPLSWRNILSSILSVICIWLCSWSHCALSVSAQFMLHWTGTTFRSVDMHISHTQASGHTHAHTRPHTNTPTQTVYPLMLLMMMRFEFVYTTGDRLLEVDGFDLRAVNHHQAVECLKRTGEVYTYMQSSNTNTLSL